MHMNASYDDLIQKIAELEKRNEELEHFADSFRVALAPMMLTGLDGHFLEVNDAFCQNLGYSQNELLQMRVMDLLPTSQCELFQKKLVMLDQAENMTFEADYLHKDGSPISFSLFARVVTHNGISVIQIIAHDITARKLAEDALQKSGEQLRRVQEIAHLGSWELDLDEKRLVWSDETYRIFGIEPQEFESTYEAFLERVHPEDRDAVTAAYTDSIRENSDTYEIVHRVTRKNSGEIRFVRERCHHERDSKGCIIRSFGMVHDITEQQQDHIKQRRLHKLNQHYLDTVQTIMMTLDREGRITMINPKGCEILGYTEEELLGKNWFTTCLVQSEGVETILQVFRQLVSGEIAAAEYFENSVRRRDGATRIIAWHNSLLTDENGNCTGTLSSGEDITMRRETEEELRQHREHLEKLVHEQTAALLASETLYRKMFELAPQSIVIIDPLTGMMVDFNTCAYENLGYSLEEFQKLTVADFEANESPEDVKAHIEKILKKGFDCFETKHRKKNGEVRDIEVRVATVHVGGKFLLQSMYSDITERKESQKKIRQSSEQLMTLINATPDIICFKDGQGRWLKANQADLQIFELEGVSYHGKTDRELADYSGFYRDAFLACEDSDEITWKKKELTIIEETIPRPDGSCKVYEVIKVPLFHPDGSRKALVVLGRDITERKQAEKAMQKSREQLVTLINASPDIICFKDAQGRWLMANEAALRLFELEHTEYMGKTETELADYSPFYQEAFQFCTVTDEQTWRKKALNRFSERILLPDGTTRILDFVKVPLFHADGRRNALVVMGRDITNTVKVTEELQEKTRKIQDTNIALQVLIDRQNDKCHDFERQIQATLNRLVIPYLEGLSHTNMDDQGREYVQLIKGPYPLGDRLLLSEPRDPGPWPEPQGAAGGGSGQKR